MFCHSDVHIIPACVLSLISQPHISRHSELSYHLFYPGSRGLQLHSILYQKQLGSIWLFKSSLPWAWTTSAFILLQILVDIDHNSELRKWATDESSKFSKIYQETTLVVAPWVSGMKAWINNEKRHLVEKYEHFPTFHWKKPGSVKKNYLNLSLTNVQALRC